MVNIGPLFPIWPAGTEAQSLRQSPLAQRWERREVHTSGISINMCSFMAGKKKWWKGTNVTTAKKKPTILNHHFNHLWTNGHSQKMPRNMVFLGRTVASISRSNSILVASQLSMIPRFQLSLACFWSEASRNSTFDFWLSCILSWISWICCVIFCGSLKPPVKALSHSILVTGKNSRCLILLIRENLLNFGWHIRGQCWTLPW